MRYFAYGSNMNLDQMSSRCPGAAVISTAMLPGHRVAFVNDASGFDGGVATAIPHDSSDVWGVVWEIDETHLEALDKWEGYPVAYDRYEVEIRSPEPSTALVYVATMRSQEPPSERYFSAILAGAQANRLSREYIETLKRWAAQTPKGAQ